MTATQVTAKPTANLTIVSKDLPAGLATTPSEELRDRIQGQINRRQRLEEKSALRAAARERRAAVNATIRPVNGSVFNDDDYNLKAGRLREADALVDRLDREVRELEDNIDTQDPAVLEAAAQIAEGREGLPVAKIGGRIATIESTRSARRDEVHTCEQDLARAKSELEDLDDRSVRAGTDLSTEVVKQEALIGRLTREARARRVALDRELEESELELMALRSALPVAERRDEQHRRVLTAHNERVLAVIRRRVARLAQDAADEQELGALAAAAKEMLADASTATGLDYSTDPDLRLLAGGELPVAIARNLEKGRESLVTWARSLGIA